MSQGNGRCGESRGVETTIITPERYKRAAGQETKPWETAFYSVCQEGSSCPKHLTKTLSSSGGIPGIPLLQDSSPCLGSSRLPERLRVLHRGGSQGPPFPGPSGATGAPRDTPCLSEGETVNYPAQAPVPSLQTAQQLLTERARGACRRHPRSSWEMQHCHISSSLYYVLVRFFSPSALPKPP